MLTTFFFKTLEQRLPKPPSNLQEDIFIPKVNQKKNRVLCIKNSFHGRTLATIFAGNNSKAIEGFSPKVDGFDHFYFGDHKGLEKAITKRTTAAIMVETIMGEGGIKVIPDYCLKGLRKLCNKKKYY